MDETLENNPKYPINEADPAKVAHHDVSINFQLHGFEEYNKQLLKLAALLGEVQKQQDILNSLQLSMTVKHNHESL